MVKRMSDFSQETVDNIIRMKYLRLVDSKDNTAYVSNTILGKIFGTSRTTIDKLITIRMK